MMIRAGDETGNLLFSKYGVTQEDILVIVVYGLGIPPLIHELRQDYPDVTHPWYEDDARAGGTFEGIWRLLDNLMERGPLRG